MVRSLGKRSLAVLLIICMLLSLLPVTQVQAANVYPARELTVGQVLNAGDQVDNTEITTGYYKYYDAQGKFLQGEYSSGLYTILELGEINSWKIRDVADGAMFRVELVPNTVAEKYTVTVQRGISERDTYEAGETVHIRALSFEGYEFTGWTADGEDITFADATKTETTFTMPDRDVKVIANFKPAEYTVTVNGGTTIPVKKYTAGETVTIKADVPEAGWEFAGWTADQTDIGITEPFQAETTFVMPARDVEVTANFKEIQKYQIEVRGGKADKTSCAAGERVTVTANEPVEGQEFAGWEADGITFDDPTSPVTTFKMPASDVKVTANFKKSEYPVTVNGGTTPEEKYKKGEIVTIKADAPEDGYEFDKWTSDGPDGSDGPDIRFDDPTSPETTFVMPAQAVTVTANFRKIPEPEAYKVTVVDGKADKATYKKGELVTVTATERDGAKFTGWVTLDNEVAFKDAKALTTTFVMPGHDTSVTATYQPLAEPYKITAGAGGSHQAGSGKDMIFACSGALEDLTGILVDGKLVDASHYHLRSGSTILTLKASYLDTLSVGTHTLRFEYKTQSVETSFKITAKADPVKPVDPVNPSNNAANPGTGLTTGTMETGAFSFIGLSVLLMGTLLINRKVRNKQ